MSFIRIWAIGFVAVISAAFGAAAASEDTISINVYAGPTDCDGENKIQQGYIAGFQYTATIHASSKAGTRGQKIESSLDVGVAPSFPVGEGKVIPGLDQGLLGLCRGAKANIIIPPHLAYGASGNPPHVVGGVTLNYDVEILSIQLPTPNDFIKIDTNQDGVITPEEATLYFKEQGQNIDVEALFQDEDKDQDGVVSWEEFSGPKGDGPPQSKQQQQTRNPNPRQEADAMMQMMDADRDGQVSKLEFEEFLKTRGQTLTDEVWEGLDTDKDGFLTREDLFSGSTPQQQQQQKQQQQQQLIAAFQNMDSNQDEKVSQSELEDFLKSVGEENIPEGFFEAFDLDQDGFISFAEFINMQQQLQKQTSQSSKQQQEKELEEVMASFREMDSNNDEKISKSELEEFLKSVGVDDLPDGFWEESDLDHDGFLSWTEFMSAQQQQQQQQQSQPTNKLSQREREEAAFHSMDTDKDGKISKSELGDFFKQAGGEMTDEFWDESDLDNDGFLSWEEFVSDANSKEHQKQEQKDEL